MKGSRLLTALLLVTLAYLTFSFLAPLLSVLSSAFSFDWSILSNRFYVNLNPIGNPIDVRTFGKRTFIVIKGVDMGIILNSLINAAIVTFFATLIGTSLALLIGLYNFRGKRLFSTLVWIPLLVAPFVNAYVTKLLYGFNIQGNTLSYLLKTLGFNVTIGFTGLGGIALAQTLAFFPIVYVNVLAVINSIDGSLIEQGFSLGAKGFTLIRKVILPLATPGILAGAVLVYILSLEDVGAPIVFNFKNVMSYQVYEFFQEYAAIGGTSASALAFLMLVFAITPVLLIRRYLSLRYYAKISKGASRPFKKMELGLKGYVAAYLLILPILIAAVAPQIGIFVLAFSEKWVGALPKGFTLHNFELLFSKEGVFRGIVNSVTYLAFSLPILAFFGFASAYLTARVKGMELLDLLATAPLAVPGLVMAFGYFTFLHSVAPGTVLDPITFPALTLVIAYATRKMPFTVRSVFTALLQTPKQLEEVAESLGASKTIVLREVVLPLVKRGLISGLMLSSIYILSEVSVSVTIGALGGDIVDPNHAGPITFVIMRLIQSPSFVGAQPQAVAASMAVILMVIEAIVFALIRKLHVLAY
ncbi:ABC transporter permease [Ignicoccus islandicus DSM 13165]|uniref:ABC transporter permease n=1 Tax=Ignicoccus islandicus DSM 13165 TaxID=940295 RepID=A0A0U2WLP6_9CREN|nr:iron ABC transporter permease [Ignicoccus islandicus]ALU11841.1 ABC transporter permease [Ignicoccus islandicus DSM 13165]